MAGSWITELQLEALAPQLAAHLCTSTGQGQDTHLETGVRGEDDVTHGFSPVSHLLSVPHLAQLPRSRLA